MKHYKDTDNNVYAFQNDEEMIGVSNAKGWNLTPITDAEKDALISQTQPTPAEQLAAARAAASMKRGPFILAMRDLGVITTAIAKEAAEGWPSAFDPFIAGLTDDEQIMAKTIWRDGRDVRRMNPILLQIQAFVNADPSLPDVSDAQLDAVFGVVA